MPDFRFNNTLTERDMDFLFAEAIGSDADFAKLFAEKCGISGLKYSIEVFH